jgi:deoxyribodipyrimidine photo-lyase
MVEAAAEQTPVAFELVDSNGLLPLRAADRVFARAFDFRRYLQKHLPQHLTELPDPDPLSRLQLPTLKNLPEDVTSRWGVAPVGDMSTDTDYLDRFPVDQGVPVTETRGGAEAASKQLGRFIEKRLPQYESDRNQPEEAATSELSPYLHFGHVSAHEVFHRVAQSDAWSLDDVSSKVNGSSSGWWGAQPEVESFFDELITWRELGFNMCWQRDDFDKYESLPSWARDTLEMHSSDPREHRYSLEEFESAQTHNPLWNAAQRQLVSEGRIHNYLRMLWGKKILEWSDSPRESLAIMIELNNKYALDGRDPNSYSGIFWCLGRYDRAWGPERPIFGKVRYMSSANTARKVRVRQYLEKYSGDHQQPLFG